MYLVSRQRHRVRDLHATESICPDGLGCPRQEVFTYAMRPLLDMPLLAVGAAFDYHAGLLKNPPAWMQRYALEWLWRLGLEDPKIWE